MWQQCSVPPSSQQASTPASDAALLRTWRRAQVEQILEGGTDVNEQDAYGETALHLACMAGQLDVVRMLVVEQQARMDVRNMEGWVPMIWGIVRGHTDIVKFLAERVRHAAPFCPPLVLSPLVREWTAVPHVMMRGAQRAGLEPAVADMPGVDAAALCGDAEQRGARGLDAQRGL